MYIICTIKHLHGITMKITVLLRDVGCVPYEVGNNFFTVT